mmetsp:Transcript_114702/g.180587  ORF Transcript_114702/g.180587 Transcript_114702/m.180587 type:complete len:239 (-) Transcript_114702:42-758(-)
MAKILCVISVIAALSRAKLEEADAVADIHDEEVADDSSSFLQVMVGCVDRGGDLEDESSLLQIADSPHLVPRGERKHKHAARENGDNATSLREDNTTAREFSNDIPSVQEKTIRSLQVNEAPAVASNGSNSTWRYWQETALSAAAATTAIAADMSSNMSQGINQSIVKLLGVSLDATRDSSTLGRLGRLREIVGWFTVAVLSILLVFALCLSADESKRRHEKRKLSEIAGRATLNDAN